MLATVCGIRPAAPGFKKIEIKPTFGKLNLIKAKMPHQYGIIEINLRKNSRGEISGFISIPEKTTGIFYWKGKQQILNEEKCDINF